MLLFVFFLRYDTLQNDSTFQISSGSVIPYASGPPSKFLGSCPCFLYDYQIREVILPLISDSTIVLKKLAVPTLKKTQVTRILLKTLRKFPS